MITDLDSWVNTLPAFTIVTAHNRTTLQNATSANAQVIIAWTNDSRQYAWAFVLSFGGVEHYTRFGANKFTRHKLA